MQKLTTEQRNWLINQFYMSAFIHADRDEECIMINDIEEILNQCTEKSNEPEK